MAPVPEGRLLLTARPASWRRRTRRLLTWRRSRVLGCRPRSTAASRERGAFLSANHTNVQVSSAALIKIDCQ